MNNSFGSVQNTSISKVLESPDTCRIQHDYHFGDEGCRRLFRWLRRGPDSEGDSKSSGDLALLLTNADSKRDSATVGFPRHLSHVELVDVGMGDAGLQELINWLQSLQRPTQNISEQKQAEIFTSLTTLDLRANKIEGTPEIAEALVSSLSFPLSSSTILGFSSSLSSLVLSNNPLSTSFRRTFFSLLPSLSGLHRLFLSFTGMDNADAIALADFIESGREKCKLVELNVNANNMRYKGVQMIVNAVRNCWTLEKVEMFSNGLSDNDITPEEIQKDVEEVRELDENITMTEHEFSSPSTGSGSGHSALDRKLKYFLNRNILLKRQVAMQALDLLRYSRLVLLKKTRQPKSSTSSLPSGQQALTSSSASFTLLPTEIQLFVLTHLAPLLSPKQRIRVFEYAADRTTLPAVKLSLPGRDHLRKFPGLRIGPNRPGASSGNLKYPQPSYTPASGGVVMDQRLSERSTQRQKWLERVRCESYDPGDAV